MSLVKLTEKLNGFGMHSILNPFPVETNENPDLELAEQMGALKSLFSQGGTFDYHSMQHSEQMDSLHQITGRLHSFDPATLPNQNRQIGFWINLYNLMILHGVAALKVRGSVRNRRAFFMRIAYRVGGLRFSANDIEHGVLRANAGHPYIPGTHFVLGDARLRYVLPLDPRIHFALNCASQSCPPIAAYRAEHLNSQLDLATSAFIQGGGIEIDLKRRRLRLSSIFNWYRRDFTTTSPGATRQVALLHFIASYLGDEDARAALITHPEQFRLSYQPYNWRLNQPRDLRGLKP